LSIVMRTKPHTRPAESWNEAVFGPERFRPVHLLRATPPLTWLLTVVFALVLAGWSVLVPQYHAPDEPNHTDAVMRLVQGEGWPRPGGVAVTPDGVGAIAHAPFGTRERPYELNVGPVPEQDATARADRPSWDALGAGQPPGGIQQIVQHPPLYYQVGANALRLLPGDADDLRWDLTIGLLRLLSVLMVAPLPLLAFHGARRLTDDENAATAAAVVPLGIPQLAHIGSTVNNDNLLVLTAGLATVAVVYVLRGDTSLRTAAFTGVFTGLALFSKSLAIVFVPMAAAAYLLAWRRARRTAKAAGPAPGGQTPDGKTWAAPAAPAGDNAAPFLLADAPVPAAPAGALRFPWRQLLLGGALAIAFGGWWWVVNIVRYGTYQPETPGFPAGKYIGGDRGVFLEHLFNGTVGRWWGAFGWFELNLPRNLVYAASALVVALFALALVRAPGARARTNLAFMLWPTWGLFGLMTLQATSHFRTTGHVTGISGRYLFAGVTSLAIGVGAAAVARRPTAGGAGQHLRPASERSPARWAPLLLLAAAGTMQVYAVSLVFSHFWEPPGAGRAQAWDAMAAWSPWPPGTLTTFAWLTAGAALAAVLGCLIHALRPAPGRRARPAPPHR
jgi:small subunit ribosomal protein S36